MPLFTEATGANTGIAVQQNLNLSQPGWPVPSSTLNWEADTRLRRLESGFDEPGGSIIAFPEEFGAIGDGVHNDWEAIQDAINSLATTGGTVQLSAKQYFITKSLTMIGGVNLQGTTRCPLHYIPKGGEPVAQIVCTSTTLTGPPIVVPANTNFWSVQDLIIQSTDAYAPFPAIQVNGTGPTPCQLFFLNRILTYDLGGIETHSGARFAYWHVMVSGAQSLYSWWFDGCAQADLWWCRVAGGVAGTAFGAPGDSGYYFHSSNTIRMRDATIASPVPWAAIKMDSNCSSIWIEDAVLSGVQYGMYTDQVSGIFMKDPIIFGNTVIPFSINATTAGSTHVSIDGGNITSGQAVVAFDLNGTAALITLIRLRKTQMVLTGAGLLGVFRLTGQVGQLMVRDNMINCAAQTPMVIDNGTQTTTQHQFQGNILQNPSQAFTLNAPTANGSGWDIRGNQNVNPFGLLASQPAVPATNVDYYNKFGMDCNVYINGGTVSAVWIGGQAVTGATSGWFSVPSRQRIRIVYTVAPTWQWFGE